MKSPDALFMCSETTSEPQLLMTLQPGLQGIQVKKPPDDFRTHCLNHPQLSQSSQLTSQASQSGDRLLRAMLEFPPHRIHEHNKIVV